MWWIGCTSKDMWIHGVMKTVTRIRYRNYKMPLSPPFLYMQVNTEVCEQTFSWLSKYSRIARHMNRERFLFYLLYLCHLRNNYKLQSKVKMYEHSTYGWELDITLILQFTHYTEWMLRAPGWVSPGTVRVTLVSRDTLTQRVPG